MNNMKSEKLLRIKKYYIFVSFNWNSIIRKLTDKPTGIVQWPDAHCNPCKKYHSRFLSFFTTSIKIKIQLKYHPEPKQHSNYHATDSVTRLQAFHI